MCGRFYIPEDEAPEALERILTALDKREPVKRGEILPSDRAPVVGRNRRGETSSFLMRWGYSFPHERPIINARSETAAQKPLFRDGMLQRRCLVPTTCYFEWQRQGNRRRKFRFEPTEGVLFWMAGIYHFEKGVPAFTVLTRAASPELAQVHERMPVLLPEARLSDWLNPDIPAEALLESAILTARFSPVELGGLS